jgi:hypothetical protein
MTTSPEKIRRAITYAVNAKKDIRDVASINHYLGVGERIDQGTLDAHHLAAREIPALHSGQGAPDGFDDFGAPVEHVEEAHVEEAHVEEVEPTLTLADAQHAVVMAQLRLRAATDRRRQARGRVSAALQKWTGAIGVSRTPEQNAREYIASSIQQRADRAAGIAPARHGRVMRSVVDATADAYNSGNGRSGGGEAFRRVVKLPDGRWVRPVSAHQRGRM